jgi:hypothetical protein
VLLGCTGVIDVSPLASLVGLKRLRLHGAPVVDRSPLALLVNLGEM